MLNVHSGARQVKLDYFQEVYCIFHLMRIWMILLMGLLAGCFSPISKQLQIDSKIEKYEDQLQSKQDEKVELGAQYVYGADYALNHVQSNTVETIIAKEMTSRAVLSLGVPDAKGASEITSIVDNYTSTNVDLQERSLVQLKTKDKELIKLQSTIYDLESRLQASNDKAQKIARENASMANTWYNIVKWVKISVYVLLGLIVLRIASIFIPPPYNNIGYVVDYIVGFLYKMLSKMFTKANDAASVVSSNVSTAFTNVVAAIQKTKNALKKEDLESDVLEGYDQSHQFSLVEVRKLLEVQSERASEVIQNNLSIATSDSDKELIKQIKSSNQIS